MNTCCAAQRLAWMNTCRAVGHRTVWPSAPLALASKYLQAKKHIASSLRDLLREGMQMLTRASPQGGDAQLGNGLSEQAIK